MSLKTRCASRAAGRRGIGPSEVGASPVVGMSRPRSERGWELVSYDLEAIRVKGLGRTVFGDHFVKYGDYNLG